MQVSFLEADVPLVKTFRKDQSGEIHKSPYPFASRFTSHTHDVSSLQDFRKAMLQHASDGHCLLKGQLQQELDDERRAGSTDARTPTEWICLDVESFAGFNRIADFVKAVPDLADTDFIVQYSASHNIEAGRLSAHLIFLLDRPTPPDRLKLWLTQLNLDIKQLYDHTCLTRTNMSLRWPLDVTTCQNDKLIYIAPPNLQGGLKQPLTMPKRIQLYNKRRRHLSLGTLEHYNPALQRKKIKARVNELRVAQGLDKHTHKTSINKTGVEVMNNPDEARITDIKQERGFVYFNLNGGDSWAYYHPENNPEILFNFKGEPNYYTKQLLPEYYAQATKERVTHPSSANSKNQETYYLAFLDPKSDVYYRGIWDVQNGTLDINSTSSIKKLNDFLVQHGQPAADYVPEWDYEFRFDSDVLVDTETRFINRYQPTPYIHTPPATGKVSVPPVTDKILRHLLQEDECYERFLNWLAVIFQKRRQAGTAWIFNGTTGTGKNLLFHRILSPIFGRDYCNSKSLAEIEDGYNGYAEDTVLLFINEAQTDGLSSHEMVKNKLKDWIDNEELSIRRMRANHYSARNYLNIIIYSNYLLPIILDGNDRRFNVAPYQKMKLQITEQEVDELANEVEAFATFLASYDADPRLARVPLENEARLKLKYLSQSTAEVVTDALTTGDLYFFYDQLPANSHKLIQQSGDHHLSMQLGAYREILVDIAKHVRNGTPVKLSREDIQCLFTYTVGKVPETPNKFTNYLKHRGIYLKRVRIDGSLAQGLELEWHAPDEVVSSLLSDSSGSNSGSGKVSKLSKGKKTASK